MADTVITVKDVKIRYRYLKKVSLIKTMFSLKKFAKSEYFEAVK